MTEADTFERADMQKPQVEATPKGDRMLVALGLLLATAAAGFPWYVFFNEDKFGIRTESFDHTRDLPPGQPRNVLSVSPLAMVDNSEDDEAPVPATDSLTTATVSSLGQERPGQIPDSQPFPGKEGFRLLHVANGRALIEDGSGMYMLKIGSILPDNSKLATIEQRDGSWVIVTSSGEVYEDTGSAHP